MPFFLFLFTAEFHVRCGERETRLDVSLRMVGTDGWRRRGALHISTKYPKHISIFGRFDVYGLCTVGSYAYLGHRKVATGAKCISELRICGL